MKYNEKEEKERIVIQIDKDLKRKFKMVLLYDDSTITEKIVQLITVYTERRMKDILKEEEKD